MEAFNLIKKGIVEGVFPGAVAAWGELDLPPKLAWAGKLGKSRFHELSVTPETIYDLASLTKALSTTPLLMNLVAKNKLDPHAPLSETPLARQMASGFWDKVSAADLMAHQSGLAAWQPFYLRLAHVPPNNRQEALMKAILESRPQAGAGQATLYSDLGFMLLGFLVESFYERPLNQIFKTLISGPLEITKKIGYKPLNWASPLHIAPTEDGRRLGGPLDFPNLPLLPEVPVGITHDDNASWLGGVSGHAGLFGTVEGIWKLLGGLFNPGSNLTDESTKLRFITPWPLNGDNSSSRAWGFDLKKPEAPALYEPLWSPRSIGHLGYTGTSFWYDPQTNFAAVFLSNRVHPSAANLSINCFRPVFYRFVRR